jgi:hypothetical protein
MTELCWSKIGGKVSYRRDQSEWDDRMKLTKIENLEAHGSF